MKKTMIAYALCGALYQAGTVQAKEHHFLESKTVSISNAGVNTALHQSVFEATKVLNVVDFSIHKGEDVELVKYISNSDKLCSQFVEAVTPMVIESELLGVSYQLMTICGDYEITEDGSYVQTHLKEVSIINTPVIDGINVNYHQVTYIPLTKQELLNKAVKFNH